MSVGSGRSGLVGRPPKDLPTFYRLALSGVIAAMLVELSNISNGTVENVTFQRELDCGGLQL